jgi:hypothetical protein
VEANHVFYCARSTVAVSDLSSTIVQIRTKAYTWKKQEELGEKVGKRI